jgi:hypothetical protein
MNCVEPSVHDDSLGGRIVRKVRVGGRARALVARLAEDEIADIYAIFERPKPG